jgi:prepilin-type N-terminal cleavage/methylation domain-containing protein
MTNHPRINIIKNVEKGFTLVEIAIVMMIIGLLIGGVFGGKRLLETARAQKTIGDLKSIESSTLVFRDTYRGVYQEISQIHLHGYQIVQLHRVPQRETIIGRLEHEI